MTQPFTFTLMDWLETECPLRNLTCPQLEWLETQGTSVSLVQMDEPTVEKSYINGSKQYREGYEIIAQGEREARLDLIRLMVSLVDLFLSLRGVAIGDGVTVTMVETTTPSLRAQTENGVIRYGFTVTIIYRD